MVSPIRFWVTTIFLAFFFAFLTAKLIQIQVVAPWPYHLVESFQMLLLAQSY
jgi:hypothetical protein